MSQDDFKAEVRLTGERVLVRPFGLDDAADYIDVVRAGEDWLPPNFPTDLEAGSLAWWLGTGVHQPHRYALGVHLAVIDRETGRLSGTIGLFRVDWGQLTCEVGYGMRPAARGRGHATEALRLVASWALRDCGLHRVELRARVANLASVRVAEKGGFLREGVARGAERVNGRNEDQYVFGLIAPDLSAEQDGLDSDAVAAPTARRAAAPPRPSPGSSAMTQDQNIAAIAAAGERTLVLHTGERTREGARAMLPKLPEVCFVDAGESAQNVEPAVRAAVANGLPQLIVVGTIRPLCALAGGPAMLAGITTVMGGTPEQAAGVAAAGDAARAYELWEAAGLLGQCGRELSRSVADQLESVATAVAGTDASPLAVQVVLMDAEATRMVGMYGRMARSG
ncbi:GNAT family N-acetyltransferase [Spirillospora sp. NPDC050679]